MTHSTTFIPSDGPDAVLLRLVRQYGLPYSRSFVSARVAHHAQPRSLLALVEVAAELGLKLTAARTESSGIADLNVPAILHFEGGGRAGFAVLEELKGDGFVVWDSVGGRCNLDRETLLENWSGVVILVVRSEVSGVRENNRLQQRFLELLAGRGVPPAFAGSSAARPLRAGLGVLIGTLLIVAVVGHPAATRPVALAMVVLTAIGLLLSIVMAMAIGDRGRPSELPGCPRGKYLNCDSVLTSPYSRIAGISLSEIGVAFFGSILLVLAGAATSPSDTDPWVTSGIAYLAGTPVAVLLIGIQTRLRQWCTFCLAVHAIVAIGATLSFVFLGQEWSFLGVVPVGILLTIYLTLILFLVVPYFMRSRRVEEMFADQQRIATSPFATVAHILTADPIDVRGPECGVRLPGEGGRHELVLFVHPSCSACTRAIEEARSLASSARVSTFLALAPRDPDEPDRRLCTALVAIGLSLGPDALLDAFSFAEENLGRLLTEQPVSILARHLTVVPDAVEKGLARARPLVERAEALADAHVDTTPSIFFDLRPYPHGVPLRHLAELLERHPDLLELVDATETTKEAARR